MKNVPDIKAGIVIGSTDWLPSELAVECGQKLVETYKTLYTEDLYLCPICVTDNEINIKRALKDINKAECNALCLYFANYGPESAGTLLAQEFDGPVMMFAAVEEGEEPFIRDRKDAISGFFNANYALNLRGTSNVYIPSRPFGTLEQCAELIHDFNSIARTLLAVRNLKIISIGPRPSSYLAASAPNHLLYDIGVELSEYSELELLDSYYKHTSDKRINAVASNMTQELGPAGNTMPEVLPKLAQYEITVEDWIRNHKGNRKYVAVTSTCWPAFPVSFGCVPCYVNSRITGKGIPVACEVDVYGALSEYIGQCVSNEQVTILNINNNVPQSVYEKKIRGKTFNGKEYTMDDLFIGYHCGVTCSDKLVSYCMEHHFVNNQLIGEEHSKGTIQGQIVPGAITMFRLQGGRDGKLRAYIAQGQILPISIDTYGGYGVIAIPELDRFLRNIVLEKHYPNHTAVVFGHYGKELASIMRLLGINEVDYNQPREIPYPNENHFALQPNWF